MKKTLLLITLVLSLCIITGCGKKENKPAIIGQWVYNGIYTYTFNEDKTCSYEFGGTKMECTYKIDGDKISILYNGSTDAFETTYKIENNRLDIIDSFGKDVYYDKKN